MEVGQHFFNDFLAREFHLNIPIYQRKYSWENKHCRKLLDDIIKIGKNEIEKNNIKNYHFVGSIFFQITMKKIAELTIIDGQQRITSISLLILALAKFHKKTDNKYEIEDESWDILINRYIINPLLKENKNKLILTEEDNHTYNKIINHIISDTPLEFDENDSKIIKNNFKFFLREINENNIHFILKGIKKLKIITLDLNDSNTPQEIFESMNSTGKDLKTSDLIRNYLLMDLSSEEQEYIYNNYWKRIESTFEKNNLSFDDFIHSYLIIQDKTPNKINKNDVYEVFKDFTKYEFQEIEEIVKDIEKYVNHFSKIVLGKEKNEDLNFALNNLNKISKNTIHPFLFKLYDDYMNQKISAEEFVKIVEYTESYIFRRYALGLHTYVFTDIFKNMYGKLDYNNYSESYKEQLLNLVKEGYNKRFPTDEEFIDELSKTDITKWNNIKYLFDRFEKTIDKNPADIYDKNYQIEHIMPQTLTDDWKRDLGDDWERIHKDYLNTIGNITMYEYNQEAKNFTFPIKKSKEKIGYDYSSVKLNRKYFDTIDKWDEDEINNRRKFLCDMALEIWRYPSVQMNLDKYESLNRL